MDYEKDVYIDETALDIECLDQPRLMIRYAKALAKAEREVERKKEDLDIVKAGLDKDIRANPDHYDIEKVTETVILNTILAKQSYRTANKALMDAQYEVKMLRGAVRAVDARKDMLEALIRLHGQQYFAGPRIPRDITLEAAKREKQSNADSNVKITRRRRN